MSERRKGTVKRGRKKKEGMYLRRMKSRMEGRAGKM
jgi:hypothetical protein